ncbi:MAG TPA: glycosyltransferase family 4 protein [Thermoleophilaceae bacterium]
MPVEALMVCSWFPFPVTSGNRKRTLRLAEAIERAGATPVLLTVEHPGDEALEEVERRGWKAHTASGAGGRGLSRLEQHLRGFPFSESASMAAALRQLAPRAAFVQLEEERFLQYARFLPAGARSVMSVYNVDSEVIDTSTPRGRRYSPSWWRAAWYVKRMQLTEQRTARKVDAVICVSDQDRSYFGKQSSNVLLVPNGVDEELLEVDPSPPEGDEVLFFGQLRYAPNREGLTRLLREVWPIVLANRPTARLRIAGPGSDAPGVRALVEGAEGVELIGFVPDLKAELARNRLVVAPLWSGGGTRLKVLEALAAARPVVGTPFAVGELGFRDGVHGRVGETADELAAGIVDLMGDDDAWRSAAAQGRLLASAARWTSVTEPAERLYRRWIEEAAGPGERLPAAEHGVRPVGSP